MQESIEDDIEELKVLSQEQFDLIYRNNVPTGQTGDQESLFLLEAYYDKISIINET